MSKKMVLITGASGGIGRDFADVFARNEYDVIVVARSADRLQALADELGDRYATAVTVIAQDLAAPTAARALFDAVTAQGLPVDELVNNAGFADYGAFVESDLAKQEAMMQLNMATLTSLTRLFLPQMVARGYGRVLNVASTAAFMPGPLMAVYYATKAYVLSFSEALASELEDTGVTVTALCPGPTQTDFQARAAMGESKLVQNREGMMASMAVAEQGFDALQAGKALHIPGALNRMQAALPRLLPRRMVPGIVRNAQARTGH